MVQVIDKVVTATHVSRDALLLASLSSITNW
jgi:hypothetical protein